MVKTLTSRPITRRSALIASANVFAIAALAMAGCGSQASSASATAASSSAGDSVSQATDGASEGAEAAEELRTLDEGEVAKSFDASAISNRGYQVFHVRTADFQFDLPSYWQGRVEWFEETLSNGYVQVSICPLGMTQRTSTGNYEFALVTVRATEPSSSVPGGDIGGGLVEHAKGSGKDVVVYQKNWTFIGRDSGPDAKAGSRKYTADQLDKLIGLATGGKLAYKDCKNPENDSACLKYNSSQFEGRVQVGSFGSSRSQVKTANEFILPDTDRVDYNVRIWNGMDNHKLFLVRNEIFARHGCGFKNQELRDYFGKQAWYKETIDAGTYDTGILNKVEKFNAENILGVEKDRNSPYI